MPEELVLCGMAECMAGEVTGEVKLYLWNATVPALPVIARDENANSTDAGLLPGNDPLRCCAAQPLASSTDSIASPPPSHTPAAGRGCASTAVHRFEGAGQRQPNARLGQPQGASGIDTIQSGVVIQTLNAIQLIQTSRSRWP